MRAWLIYFGLVALLALVGSWKWFDNGPCCGFSWCPCWNDEQREHIKELIELHYQRQ